MHQNCVGADLVEKRHTFKHLVLSEYNCGLLNNLNHFDEPFYYFMTLKNTKQDIDLSPIDKPGMLVAGGTTFTSAIHFAYYLGAKNIIICGHDCGTLDEGVNFDGYYNEKWSEKQKKLMKNGDMQIWESQSKKLIDELRRRGANILSLNPFINLGLEGHQYNHFGKGD